MKHFHRYRHNGTEPRVLIADDHPIEREGIKNILEKTPQFNIIGETACGAEAVDFIQQVKCDLVVADIKATDYLSVKIIHDIRMVCPRIAILALGSGDETKDVSPLFRAGANGYFHKTCPNHELLQAIRTITSGKRYLSPDIEDRIADSLDTDITRQPHELLSFREREVMSLLSTGKTVTEISKELSLNIKTISTYKSRIFEKLNITNGAHLIMYAFQNNLVY